MLKPFLGPDIDTLEQHRAHPEITPAAHSRALHHMHARVILSKIRIYLDQNYWIYCRDAARGVPQKPVHAELWRRLRGLVEAGKAVCPAGFSVFLETQKQGDAVKRGWTAQVIDTLSKGAAIRALPLRTQIELRYVIRKLFLPDSPQLLPMDLIWTFPMFFLERLARVPADMGYEPATERAFQKAWLDQCAVISFSDMLAFEPSDDLELNDAPFVSRLEVESKQYRHEFDTFERAREIEIKEALKALEPEIADVHVELCGDPRYPAEFRAAPPDVAARSHAVTLYALLKEGRLKWLRWTDLPSLHIQAAIHAELRLRGLHLKKGDTYDWLHAGEALPYAQYFFTEGNLRDLLRRRKLDTDYGCTVLADDDEILAALERIGG